MCPANHFALADITKVLDTLPVGVMTVNLEGHVIHINEALSSLTGFSVSTAQGLPCRHVLRSSQCVSGCELGCNAFSAASSGTNHMTLINAGNHNQPASFHCETTILNLKKRLVPVRLSHFSVTNDAGEAIFRLDVVQDLTEMRLLEQNLLKAHGYGKIIGKSAEMERILTLIPGIAQATAPVLISGETGTGKDLLADTLHQASSRSREAFVRITISAMPEEILLKELFGEQRENDLFIPGRFQQAEGGTLYFPELADISPAVQRHLLHYLDTGTILPIGERREHKANVRIITATCKDTAKLVQDGIIGPELLYRLGVVHVKLPPLRDRTGDCDFLLQHFLTMYANRFHKPIKGFSKAVLSILENYAFPGNVRELKNIIEYAVMVCPDSIIDESSMPGYLIHSNPHPSASTDTKKSRKKKA